MAAPDDSAETTMGPEPADETTPASDEAMMLAPTAEARDDVTEEAGVVAEEAGVVAEEAIVVETGAEVLLLVVTDPAAGQVRL